MNAPPLSHLGSRLLLQTLTSTCPRCKAEKTTTLDKAYYLCSACRDETKPRAILDINSLDPLDPKYCDKNCCYPNCDSGYATGYCRQQFDRERDLEERGLVERDAYNEEHPRNSNVTDRS